MKGCCHNKLMWLLTQRVYEHPLFIQPIDIEVSCLLERLTDALTLFTCFPQ